MKIRLVSLAIAVGLCWGCQTQTVMLKATKVEQPPLDVKVRCHNCKTEIKFGPSPGDGTRNLNFGPNPGDGIDVNFGPGPGKKKMGLPPPKYMRKRSYA